MYESDGRKRVAKYGVRGPNGEATANLVGCRHAPLDTQWMKVSTTPEAEVFTSDQGEYLLSVVPKHTNYPYHCTYQFDSAQEMVERTDAAIELTLLNMGLSLGEFAFLPISHLK